LNKIKYTLAELIADLATSFCRDTSKIVFLDNGYFEIDHDEYKKSYRDDRINKPYEIPESLYKFLSLRVTIENTVEVIDQLEDTMLITVEIDEGEGIFTSDADWRQVFWAQDVQRGHRGPRVQTNEGRIVELLIETHESHRMIDPQFICSNYPYLFAQKEVEITKRIHLPLGSMTSEDYYRSELAEVESELTKLKSDLALALGNSKQP
jgi:hypothetical protein